MFLAIKRKYPNKPPTAKTIQFVNLLNGCFKLTRKEKAFLPSYSLHCMIKTN